MFNIIFTHSYNDNKFSFFILRIQGSDKLNKLVLIDFWTYFNSNWVGYPSEELYLWNKLICYMCTVELSRSFPNPEHMSRVAIVLSMLLSGECSFIRKNKSLMWCEHLSHVLKQIIMSTYRVKISFAKLTVLRLSALYMQTVYVISLVIVYFLAIVYHELWRARFCILTCNPSDYHWLFGARRLYYRFALVIELHFILISMNKILSKTRWFTC